MEVVINYEFLKGSQDEFNVKETAISANNLIHTLHFKNPNSMHTHGSTENGINWDDGQIDYDKLQTAMK